MAAPSGTRPVSESKPPRALCGIEVMNDIVEGLVQLALLWARSNRVPDAARRSSCGVFERL